MKLPFDSASRIRRNVAELVRPPRRVPVSRTAEEHVRVKSGGSTLPYAIETAPYMQVPQDLVFSRKYRQVIFVAPARTGKTQALCDNILVHSVLHDPGDMMIVFAQEILAHDFSRRRLTWLQQHVPAYAEKLLSGHNDNVTSKVYSHGMILNLGWPSTGQLSQRDLRTICLTEYDSMADSLGAEGSVFSLARKRVEAAMSGGVVVAESSPKKLLRDPDWLPPDGSPHMAPPVEGGGILALYNTGTRCRWYWACLHCGTPFEAPARPEYDDLEDIRAAGDTAFVPCPHCGGIHTQKDKVALHLHAWRNQVPWWQSDDAAPAPGEGVGWVPDPGQERNDVWSGWVLGTTAAYQPWAGLVMEHLKAKRLFEATGDEELLISTTNVDQGMPYLPSRLTRSRSANSLRHLVEPHVRGFVPDEVRFLLTTVDVQGHSFDVQVKGYAPGDECWIIDRYSISVARRQDGDGRAQALNPAAYFEDWLLLAEEVLPKEYEGTDGRKLSSILVGVDSGGREGVTPRAYEFYRWCRKQRIHPRIRLLKGDSDDTFRARTDEKRPLVMESWPTGERKDRHSGAKGDVPVQILNTTLIKDDLNGRLLRVPPSAGSFHVPSWGAERMLAELVSEMRTPKGWVKVKSGIPNETWDHCGYGLALCHMLGTHKWGENWESAPQWAQKWERSPKIVDKAPTTARQSAKPSLGLKKGGKFGL